MRYKESIEEPEAASLLLFHAVHRAIDNDNCSRCEHNGCQILLFRSAYRIVKSIDFHFDYGSIFGVSFRSVYQSVKINVHQMTPIDEIKGSNIDDNKDLNNNTCYGFYLDGNYSNNVDTSWYYFVNSNNVPCPSDSSSRYRYCMISDMIIVSY